MSLRNKVKELERQLEKAKEPALEISTQSRSLKRKRDAKNMGEKSNNRAGKQTKMEDVRAASITRHLSLVRMVPDLGTSQDLESE